MPAQRRRAKPLSGERKGDTKAFSTPRKVTTASQKGLLFLGFFVIVSIGYHYVCNHPFKAGGRYSAIPDPTLEDGGADSDVFQVVDLPGKGKGLISKRYIEQGELIIKERPLFVVPDHINSSPSVLISQLLRETSSANRQAFFNLSYVNLPKNLSPEQHMDEVALAIFQTNAVAAGDGVGIFPRMARLNHGCSSAFNVVYSWREREQALMVHALKRIQKGEELLTTYTNTRRPRSERRAFLEDHYGFFCTCSVCSLPDAQSRASDKRLVEMSDHYKRFATWGEQRVTGIETIEIIKKIWLLGDEEGYWSERGRLAADAVWVAASHSDITATRQWAALAVEWYTYELGKDSEYVGEMKKVVIDPQRHSAWGSRERSEVGGPGR